MRTIQSRSIVRNAQQQLVVVTPRPNNNLAWFFTRLDAMPNCVLHQRLENE
jgi:hypothetical protein